MRRFAVLLLFAAAAALVPASKADAYKLFKHRWYSKTLTYYDATGGLYKSQVRAAASALNRSGARIKVRSASRRTARVRISVSRRLPTRNAGQARYTVRNGVARKARILLQPNLLEGAPSPGAANASAVTVIAHELAHVLGLNHEDRRCAMMNSRVWGHCNRPQVAWQYRCRALERDDVRGLVRRFGGRVKSIGPELCEAEAAPAPPVTAAAAQDSNGNVSVSWTEGAVPLVQTEVLRKLGSCPTGRDDTTATLVARIQSAAGQAQSINDQPPGPGSYCYAIIGLGPLGRPGVAGTAGFTYVASPRANFTAAWADAPRNTQLRLTDTSTDADGQIVAWRWDFGDGTSSTQRNPPLKSWSRAGTYTVTLTVTDTSGLVGTASTQIVIQGGSNRGTIAH